MSGVEIHSYDSGREPDGPIWTTEDLQRDFEVIGFAAPFVDVRRRSDGAVGSLEFIHRPRVYFGWKPA